MEWIPFNASNYELFNKLGGDENLKLKFYDGTVSDWFGDYPVADCTHFSKKRK